MAGCLLVPLDGSTLSKRALPYAVALAAASRRTLRLLRVLTPHPPRGEALVQESAAMADLEQIARGLRAKSLDVEVEISSSIFGDVSEVIVDTAQRSDAELIVMSTHGRGGLGNWVYRSVAERVLRLATTPVFLVPVLCGRTWPMDRRPRILLTSDGSPLSGLAVEPARVWAQLLGAEVVLVRVVPPSSNTAAAYVYEESLSERTEAMQSLDGIASAFRQAGIDTSINIPDGEAAACVAALALVQDVDVIAMATHGRSGISKVVLGSVATETLHRAAMPMLLVRAVASRVEAVADSRVEPASPPHERLRLLVALDLSARSDAVLPLVSRLAHLAHAEVVLLNVFIPAVELGDVFTDSRQQGLQYVTAERRMYLERKAEELTGLSVSVQVEALEHGVEIDEGIARVAAKVDADILLVGSSHAASAAGLILGSRTSGLLRLSPCPVLVVRAASRAREKVVLGEAQEAL